MPKLSIIIVNWNTKELVTRCIESIFQHVPQNTPNLLTYEIFLIDNASSDNSAVHLAHTFHPDKHPNLTLIQNSQNLGFAKAVNQGIARATGEYILLLNPDTELVDNAFLRMIDFMNSHPRTGILGPRIIYPDGSLQPSCRRFPTPLSQALILLKIHNLAPKLPPLRAYFMTDFDYSRTQEVDQVMGACFLIRRAVIDKIGLLDEGFFIWFEEVDFCKRAAQSGFLTTYMADATIIHYKGQSFAQVESPRKQRYINRSLVRYMKKHASPLATLIIAALTPFSLALSYVVHIFHLTKPNKNL